jgi:hypothetical protein
MAYSRNTYTSVDSLRECQKCLHSRTRILFVYKQEFLFSIDQPSTLDSNPTVQKQASIILYVFKDMVRRKRTVLLNKHAYVNPILSKKMFQKKLSSPATAHRPPDLSFLGGLWLHETPWWCSLPVLPSRRLKSNSNTVYQTMSRFSWPCLRGKDSKRLILVVAAVRSWT